MSLVLTAHPTEVKINGESIIGKIDEVTVSLKRKFKEQNPLGVPMPVDVPVPGKFEKPEVKIKWSGAPPVKLIAKILSPNFFGELEFTSRIWGVTEQQGLVQDEDLTVRIKGWFKGIPDLIAKEDSYESETEISPTFLEFTGTKSGLKTIIGIEGILKDELNITSQGVK